jgi:hypothetical protein
MPFTVRPHRRFPVYCPVTYQTDLFEGVTRSKSYVISSVANYVSTQAP